MVLSAQIQSLNRHKHCIVIHLIDNLFFQEIIQPETPFSPKSRGRKEGLSSAINYYPSLWSINSAFELVYLPLIAMLEATSYRYEVMQPKTRTLQNTGAQQVRIKVRFHTLYLAIICCVGLQCSKQV